MAVIRSMDSDGQLRIEPPIEPEALKQERLRLRAARTPTPQAKAPEQIEGQS
jgi:hypothetical protein